MNIHHIADSLRSTYQKTYFNDIPLTQRDLSQSRKISIFEGCSARTIVTICSGPFLAGLLKYFGANDQVNGVIGAIPTLAGAIMLFSPLFLERLDRRKSVITFSAFLSRLLLSLMFFAPLIFNNSRLSICLVAGIFLAANLFVSFITPAATNWVISITPQQIRGRYFGLRESVVLGVVTIVALLTGRALDYFNESGNERTGFYIIFLISFLLAITNFVLSSLISEPKVELIREKLSVRNLFTLPFGNSVFRRIILLFVLWNIGFQFSAPFTAVYMVSGLKLDYIFITLCSLVASAASIAGARILGRLADKRSWLFLMMVCVCFQITSQFMWFFVNNSTAEYLIPISQFLGGVAVGGINITLNNIQYQFSPKERKTVYIGFSSAAGALAGFLSSLLGAAFVGYTGKLTIELQGFRIGNMQLLFLISGVLLLICIFYIFSLTKMFKKVTIERKEKVQN